MYQVYSKYFNDPTMFQPLKAMKTIFCALNEISYLFEKESAVDVTEYDYLGNIWLPLFRILLKKKAIFELNA